VRWLAGNFNNDGTALYEAMAVVRRSDAGHDLSIYQQLLVVLYQRGCPGGRCRYSRSWAGHHDSGVSCRGTSSNTLPSVDGGLVPDRCRTTINVGDINVAHYWTGGKTGSHATEPR
jgi:hypothetical protein